jgi:hypothetical protein
MAKQCNNKDSAKPAPKIAGAGLSSQMRRVTGLQREILFAAELLGPSVKLSLTLPA